MPRFTRRRRGATRRGRPTRRNFRRKAVRRVRRGPRQGLLHIMRHSAQVIVKNGPTPGTPILTYPEGIATPPYPFVMGTATGDGINAYDIPFAFVFQLDLLTSYTELTAIADRYKINRVWVRAYYACGSINVASNTAPSVMTAQPAAYPTITWYNDYDDATANSISVINERMGTKSQTFRGGRFIQMSCKPKFLMYGQNDTPSSALTRPSTGYIDCAHPDIPHYGIKGCIRGMSLPDSDFTNVYNGIKFDIVYSVSLRDVA